LLLIQKQFLIFMQFVPDNVILIHLVFSCDHNKLIVEQTSVFDDSNVLLDVGFQFQGVIVEHKYPVFVVENE